jgi:hypothetical protein
MSRAALLSVVQTMSQRVTDLRQQQQQLQHQQQHQLQQQNQQQSNSVSDGVPATIETSRARAILDHSNSIWSLNGLDDEEHMDESKSEKSEEHSRVTMTSAQRQLSDENSEADTRCLDVTSLVTKSRRVRQLLDGVTVITSGKFGNSKTKLLSLSPDLKQLIWKDILNNTSKQEDIAQYKGFIISDCGSEGVTVKYEHKSKSKKMEIPRNNLQPEENRSRVLKWIGLLNSLRKTAT